MKRLVEKFIKVFIRRTKLHTMIETLINEDKINDCYAKVSSNGAVFYEQAKVYNFQNDNKQIRIDEHAHIRGELLVFAYGGNIRVGSYCYIGEGTRIWSGDAVMIGNNVLISHNVNIIDTNSHEIEHVERAEGFKHLLTKGHAKEKGNIRTAPITIKDNAWISFNATVLKGVVIGEGAIVAANSVVTKDVPAWSIVAGNPAEVIKRS